MASIYLPPIARKKKVDGYPRHNTSRVFADLQGNCAPSNTSYDAHYIGHASHLLPQQSAMSLNKPHPSNVTFLRQNPRFICEPVCYVKTAMDSPVKNPSWWPDETPESPTKVPKRSFDSTSRTDYCTPLFPHDRITQYSSNLAMRVNTPAAGIIPQGAHKTVAKKPKVVEKISYEHQYNSRLDPSHTIRGRRHGSFIWKVASDVGRPNRKNSKPVEYAYTAEDPVNAVTADITGDNSTKDSQLKELSGSEEIQSSSNES